MSELYIHTLIAKDNAFVPSAKQVHTFLGAVLELGVVPGEPSLVLRTRSGKTREYPNPFSGGTISVELKNQKKLKDLAEFDKRAAALSDYEIEVSGEGKPKLPPVPIQFNEPYFVGVTCLVSSKIRSTSDYHDESDQGKNAVSYGEVCERAVSRGIYSNPHDLDVIEVAGAGCARFWVQFELGKFLFPQIVDGNLELLDPAIVRAAKAAFGMRFVQGCYWG